ncbi:hypothetical protein [Geomicrobium sp. JCM 19039]|uniref:hypothetical protein n=1 Tax=Geomicrobium sp. JCM 19039 TaxID=1460636 RepID=UPI00045F179B|nr:hypothetical protein [Geomicrobium sp. JCM 19039]GAK12639.1 hypothetical protein JCM19039_2431 [Geomicrobium sp. JCM 19039]
MSFLRLLFIELNRIRFLFLALVAIVVITQFALTLLLPRYWVGQIESGEMIPSITFTFINVFEHGIYSLSLALPVITIGLYIFIVWYRDWFGQGTFMKRLLMLPSSRMNVFAAKLVTIVLVTLAVVSIYRLVLPLQMGLFEWVLPNSLYGGQIEPFYLFHSLNSALAIVYPPTLLDFFVVYGLGITLVCVLFSAILFERSFGFIGLGIGAAYVVAAFMLYGVASHFVVRVNGIELLLVMLGVTLGICAVSLFVSRFLLLRKVTV